MIRIFVERLLTMPYLMETPGDEGAGGGGTGDGKLGADNGGDHKPGADGVKPEGGVKPGAGGTKPVEDPRIAGLMADLKKERIARQKFEKDYGTTSTELELERKRVQALSGVNPKSPEEETDALVRQRMKTLYPWIEDLTAEDIKAIRESRGQMDEIRNATTNTWRAHGQKMLDQVTDGVGKALGGKLSDRQAARISQAYVEEARNNPEFLKRHEAGDPRLVAEFVKDWLDDFVEPGKRQALQSEALRRPRVPGGKDRSLVGADNKPIDVKDDKAVGDLLVKGFRERGGQFGSRR